MTMKISNNDSIWITESKENKIDSKDVGDFIWDSIDLLNPENDPLFLGKAYRKLYKSGKRGTAYEINLIDAAIAVEEIFGKDVVDVILRKPTEDEIAYLEKNLSHNSNMLRWVFFVRHIYLLTVH